MPKTIQSAEEKQVLSNGFPNTCTEPGTHCAGFGHRLGDMGAMPQPFLTLQNALGKQASRMCFSLTGLALPTQIEESVVVRIDGRGLGLNAHMVGWSSNSQLIHVDHA